MGSLDKDKYFKDYNHYQDRGIMKWQTAYNMEELASGISENHNQALKSGEKLSVTSLEKKEQILEEAFFSHHPLFLQTFEKDSEGCLKEGKKTYFLGIEEGILFFSTGEKLRIDEIRHLHPLEEIKWFKVSE